MFINFWYAAERSERLTDQPLKVRMLGQDFVLFRDSRGHAHCLANVCVHRGGSLAGGKVRGDCVQCPYHGWEFDGAGQCHKIPSLGRDARIPARARVDAYPVEERYGLIHVFLGDLPEVERPPIMPVPEYGREGWRATHQDYEAAGDYRRSTENGLDPAHNEFVHPTHGFSGARDDYIVPEVKVEETAWGSGFLIQYFSPPLKEAKMQAASGRSNDAVINAGTHHHGPSCAITRIFPTPDVHIFQYVFKTPVDVNRQRTFLVQMRNFLIEPENDPRFCERNEVVRNQDLEVLLAIQPEISAGESARELLMPADRAVARYRQKLAEWQARGWCIDTGTVTRETRRKVFAIPCPARRENPKGWVIDAVPLLPATAAIDSAGAHAS